MAYVKENPNPHGSYVGDCVVRALSIATGDDWDTIYLDLCIEGLMVSNMPSANVVWGDYLKKRGYKKNVIPDTCPHCYTVKDFTKDHPKGTFILGTGSHVVAVIDGDYHDDWDSGDENPIYFWHKEE